MIDEVLGKVSAYAYAVEKGYTGTEEQFAYDLAHAADYASTAGMAAENASESEENAKDSEEAAALSEGNAQTYANNAHSDAAAALDAKTQAVTAKNDAVTAKGLAENYASVANNAKTAAAQSEQNASQSAENASDDAEAASNSASSASANSLKSEGFAVGEQNGVPVESGSPYYENNAKYYCEEAGKQLTLVTNEGTRQIGLVTDEGTAQKAAVQEKGEQTLASIPEDYTTLRNDVSSLKSDLNVNVEQRLTAIDGLICPNMELGKINMSSSVISFASATNIIRTPQTGGIPVSYGDIIHLTDYTVAKYRYCILKSTDNKYTYTNVYLTTDYTIVNDGILYLLLEKSDESDITDVSALASLIRVYKNTGALYDLTGSVTRVEGYDNILETARFPDEWFANGDVSEGKLLPTTRTYRIGTKQALSLDFNVYLKVASAFRIAVLEYLNGTWTRRGGSSAWLNAIDITKGTLFCFVIARKTENTSELADVSEFVSAITVNTDLTNKLAVSEGVQLDMDAISEYMSHFYASNEAEAYAFFTDPHLMGSAGAFSESTFNQYMSTLVEIVKETSTAYVVCGGDWLNREDTKAQAAVKLGYVDGEMRSMFPDRYYPIVGNHDFNYLGYENGSRLPESQWISNSAMRNFWFHDHDQCYYKFKRITAQNYVLNTRTDYDGTNTYDKSMLDWLAQNLIEDDAPHSTIMFHMYYLSSVGTTVPKRVVAIGKIIAAYNSHSVCTLTNDTEGYDKTYDFTGTTGHIDYVIVGHTHADFDGTFGGVPIVGCDNFTDGGVATFDLVFADYTNHKLYLTRVGTGTSRSFDI